MNNYERKRAEKALREYKANEKNNKGKPKKDIPVEIRKGLVVYTDDEKKIPMIKLKYAGK